MRNILPPVKEEEEGCCVGKPQVCFVTATGRPIMQKKKKVKKILKVLLLVDIWPDLLKDGLLAFHKLHWVGDVEEVNLRLGLHRRFSPLFEYFASFFQLQLLQARVYVKKKERKNTLVIITIVKGVYRQLQQRSAVKVFSCFVVYKRLLWQASSKASHYNEE